MLRPIRLALRAQPLIYLMAAPSLEAARYRACASHRACMIDASPYQARASRAAAHLFDGCALTGLHSQPLISYSDLVSRRIISPMRIGITGSTGLVGSALIPVLTSGGHQIFQLRRPAHWNPEEGTIDREAL